MHVHRWAEFAPGIRQFAQSRPHLMPYFWRRLMNETPSTITRSDRVLMAALSEISEASVPRVIAVLDALVRWAPDAPRYAAPRDLHDRVKLLRHRGDAVALADAEALDALLAGVVRRTAPPGLLESLKAVFTGEASTGAVKVGDA